MLIRAETTDMDVDLARRDVLDADGNLLRRHPEVGTVVLKCTNMLSYAAALRAALGTPVYDVYSVVAWLHAGPGGSDTPTRHAKMSTLPDLQRHGFLTKLCSRVREAYGVAAMDRVAGAGYLARVEANMVGVRAGPGVVYIRLSRDFASEGQQTAMFAEVSPGGALKLIRELQDCVGIALACGTPA